MPSEEWSFGRRLGGCLDCSRDFRPGDALFSALYQEKAELVRRDYCPACWEGRRGGAEFSFWRAVVPEPEDEDARKKRRIDSLLDADTLLDILREMQDSPDPQKRRFRFVLSLMLLRRKKLKLVEITRRRPEGTDGEEDILVLDETGRGVKPRFEIVDVKMSEEEMIAAQDEVGKLLAMGGVEEATGEGEAEGAGAGGASGAGEDARGFSESTEVKDGAARSSREADEAPQDDRRGAGGPVEARGPEDSG